MSSTVQSASSSPQIVRSPGMYYGDEVDKADQHIYSATVIPYRGAWLEYETDLNNVFYVRIDKTARFPSRA